MPTLKFAAAAGVLVVASVSPPLHGLAHDLFAAHMVQHLVLLLAASPLLAAGLLRTGRRAPGLVAGLAIHTAALWLWHVPALYDASVRHEALHVVEHATFLGAGTLYWWGVLDAARVGRAGSVASLFLAALGMGMLAALVTLAAHPWYAAHAATAARHGLSPLGDQQLGGVIMWVPGGTVYVVAGAWVFARWLRSQGPEPAVASDTMVTA